MSDLGREVPRDCRLQVFFARMARHRPFTSFGDADQGITTILKAVEDELTDIPHDPEAWKTDGRLYPAQSDHWYNGPSYPHVTQMRTRGHSIFVSASGALEIWDMRHLSLTFTKCSKLDLMEIRYQNPGSILFSKDDAEGRKVWDNE
jgi:hypothetical protein